MPVDGHILIVSFRGGMRQQVCLLLNTPVAMLILGVDPAEFGHDASVFVSIFVCRLRAKAGVAQLVEQLICNHQVVGSSPITGSSIQRASDYFSEP